MSPSPEAPAAVRVLPALWYGALRDASGYADEARAFLLALERCGYAMPAQDVRWTTLDAGCAPAQRAAVERATSLDRPLGDHVVVHHRVPSDVWVPALGAANVCRTMFETDRVPRSFLSMLAGVDAIWVPSEFNVETFQAGGVPGDRIRVLPGTLDFDLFTAGVEPLPIGGRRGFTFLTLFDFTDRKGWDVLLDAWADAFAPDDDVCLVLKCLPMHHDEREIRERIDRHLAGRRTAPLVVRLDVLAGAELPRLYAAADAFVLASRGEGWGRPYMEAMAMGLPTIGSRWSANLTFMNDGNAWLVDGDVVPIPDDAQQHTPIYKGQRWFQPDREALAAHMRELAHDPRGTAARAAGARAELIERFGPELVAARVVELVEEALERQRWRRSRPVACSWRGEWGGVHSLAVVNDGLSAALERAGYPVHRVPPGGVGAEDGVGIAQQWPPRFDAPSAGPFVLAQPWEYGRVPLAWVDEICEHVDEVWACSSVVRDAYVESGVPAEIVHVVPCGVDLSEFAPEGPAQPFPEAATRFLFVGGTLPRKGVDLLLEAYRRAFDRDDDVVLVVKDFGTEGIYRGNTAGGLLERFSADPRHPRLEVIDADLPRSALPALYRGADVLVQPYRGEGFCLPALEALACGVPVIVTAGGATDDFVDDGCGWRVPARRIPLAADAINDELLLAGEGFMLEVDVDRLAEALVEATDAERRSAKAARAREAAAALSWDRVAALAAARIEALHGCEPVRRAPRADLPERRATVFACLPDWDDLQSWLPAVEAYLAAFTPTDDVTLALASDDPERDGGRVVEALREAGHDLAAIPDLALADASTTGPQALALTADAVVSSTGARSAARARRVLRPEPEELAAFAAARAEGD